MSTNQVFNVNDTKLTISLPKELHAFIKSKAALKHTTVKAIVTDAILESFHDDFSSLNEKTKKQLEQSIKDYKSGNLKSFSNADDAISFLNS